MTILQGVDVVQKYSEVFCGARISDALVHLSARVVPVNLLGRLSLSARPYCDSYRGGEQWSVLPRVLVEHRGHTVQLDRQAVLATD